MYFSRTSVDACHDRVKWQLFSNAANRWDAAKERIRVTTQFATALRRPSRRHAPPRSFVPVPPQKSIRVKDSDAVSRALSQLDREDVFRCASACLFCIYRFVCVCVLCDNLNRAKLNATAFVEVSSASAISIFAHTHFFCTTCVPLGNSVASEKPLLALLRWWLLLVLLLGCYWSTMRCSCCFNEFSFFIIKYMSSEISLI